MNKEQNIFKLRKAGRPAKVNPKKALELLARGINRSDVARTMGVNVNNLTLRRLEKIIPKPEEILRYQAMRNNLLTMTEAKLIDGLNDESKLEKASINNIAYAFQQVHTARRLEEGRSTENKSYAVLVAEETSLLRQLYDFKLLSGTSTEDLQVPDIIRDNGQHNLSPMDRDNAKANDNANDNAMDMDNDNA